jgi:hypothetical protein
MCEVSFQRGTKKWRANERLATRGTSALLRVQLFNFFFLPAA